MTVQEVEGCTLCREDLAPLLAEGRFWRLILNRNQNLLGKCFWVFHRHCETITQLGEDEWQELHQQIVNATNALHSAFQPDHYNYAFLQNQGRHVHMHIIPRYAQSRGVVGITFDDPDYPAHYNVASPPRQLDSAHVEAVTELLRLQPE